ncbi:MAG: hypothetical protein K8R48_05275 [Alphaproteobacteria bacterium]|nr:hypothetical protein [Alphaproteobacteria bacterium]
MKIFLLLCALLLLTAPPALAAPALYSLVIEDLPLMPGMVEKPDEAVDFDSPSGRIVETAAETEATATDILGFYAGALPPLGWTVLPPYSFTREDETLVLDIAQKNGVTLVRFNLTPRK